MLEPTEVARWERLTDAMLGHAAADDPEALRQVLDVLDRAYDKLPEVVAELRRPKADGRPGHVTSFSWAQIGAALGVTRASAQQRFGVKARA